LDPPRTVPRPVIQAAAFWLLLVTLAGLAYARAIPLGPFSDDHWLLAFAQHGSFNLSWFHIKSNSWTPFHRPFVLTVWKALGPVFGDAAPAYRVWLLGMHALNASLVLLLLRQGVPASRGLAWAAAALFLFAPAPEVLIWLSGLYDATATLFYLGTILCAIRYWQTGRAGWFALSLVACQLSVWSKETAFTLPAVLALVAWWVPRRPFARRVLLLALPCVLIIAANLGQRYLAWHALGGYPLGSPSVATLVRRSADGFLFAVMLVPVALFELHQLVPPLALLLAILAAGWLSGRQRRTMVFGAAWFVLTIVPVLVHLDPVLLERQGQNSRFLYLPGVGAAITVGAALFGACDRWLPARARVPPAVTALICAIQVAVLQVHINAWQVADRAVRAIPAAVHRVVPSLAPFTCLQVLNLPKHHNGAYIYWIGLDAALLSHYGMVIGQYCGGVHTPLAIDDPAAADGLFQVQLATDERLADWDVAWARGVSPREPRPSLAAELPVRIESSVAGRMDIPELVERAVAGPAPATGSTVADWPSTGCGGPDRWRLPSAARCQAGTGVVLPASPSPASIELPARVLDLPAWAEIIASVRILGDRWDAARASVRWKDRHGAWRTDGTRAIELPRRAGGVNLHFFVAPRAHQGTIAQLALDVTSPGAPVAIDRIVVRALP
jgi:hypothetical protein